MDKKVISILLPLCLLCIKLHAQQPVAWAETNLQAIDQLQSEYADKINAALAAKDAVQKAGAYIESLTELANDGVVTLPVGIKKGDYELIIQGLRYDEATDKTVMYATCAFKLKDNGQKIAFGGEAVIQGQKGVGSKGELALLAPVRINLGRESAIIVQKGSKVVFGCEGVESFTAKVTWLVTSENIVAVSQDGAPLGTPLAASSEVSFSNFDSYTISLDVNQSFSVKWLKDVVFSLRGAVIDQSDAETPTSAHFPAGYFSSSAENELWRGVALTGASVTLPPFARQPEEGGAGKRMTLALDSAVFDANGFTGSANLQLPGSTLPQGEWALSVNALHLKLVKNQLRTFGFAGEMNLPPLGGSSRMPYMARFNPTSNDYEFQVNFSGKYDFPVLQSKLEVNENSYINVRFVGSEFYPTLNASGKISINAPIAAGEGGKGFSVPDITFENLRLSREQPYLSIGAIGVEGNLSSPEIGGFTISIEDIHSFNNGGETGLALTGSVGLSDMFDGLASVKLYGDYASWKFKKVEVERIRVDFRSKAFSVKGDVFLKNGDKVYGDGFRGALKFNLIEKFDLDAVAVFGKVDGYRYFLTDVFLETAVESGIKVAPGLSFYGFGGGLYSKMRQESGNPTSDFGKSLSGINYLPDKQVGMGFMASTKFALAASSSAFNANVGLEIQFNQNGGLNFVQLRGDAVFMSSPAIFGGMLDNVSAQLQKAEKGGGQIKQASKTDLGEAKVKSSAMLSASILMKYDVTNSTFAADMKAYLDAQGIIKGVGENGCMGWASALFAPNTWHVYVGTPSDQVGVDILGLAKAHGYFMLGDGIPPLPMPPPQVTEFLTPEMQQKLEKGRTGGKLEKGTGIAFGAGLEVKFNPTLPPFYARFELGLGTEFLLTDLKGKTCEGFGGTPGLNGWYAQAQAWAHVNGAIGLEARIFRKTRQFEILEISAATMLAGAGPNPTYFTGMVGGKFSVMGGLISGSCKFNFEVGEKCTLVGDSGSPFEEEIISQLTPSAGVSDVNVFAVPQALFNIPVGIEMTVDEEAGSQGKYMVTLEEFSLKYKDGRPIALQQKLSSDGTVCALDPAEPFESKKEIQAYAKVSFKQLVNGAWAYVKGDDGNPVFEEKSTNFTSGERPKEFQPEHVKYSYPLARQYNFYADEYRQGYIQLTQNYEYLFTTDKPADCKQVLRVTSADGKVVSEAPFTYKQNGGNGIKFEVNHSMQEVRFDKNQIYKLSIVNVPNQKTVDVKSNISVSAAAMQGHDDVSVAKQSATGVIAQADEKEIYAIHFRTSSYKTFVEKMNAIPHNPGGVWQEYPHVYELISNIYDYTKPAEMFDAAEVASPAQDAQLIMAEPIFERTAWYTQKVAPLIYNSRLLADAGLTGLKPATSNVVSMSGTNPKPLDDNSLTAGTRLMIEPYGSISYRAAASIDNDYCNVRNALANRVIKGVRSAEVQTFLNSDHIPDMSNGQYPVRFSYRLPGAEGRVTSSVEKTISLSGFID